MRSTNRVFLASLALAAAALASPALAQDEITFATNWVAEAEHGGFYQAVADGTYEQYGLKVTIIAKGDRALLLSGKAQFYMNGNLLGTFSAIEQGIPVIEVAAIFQKDPQVIMAHPEMGIKSFADLTKVPTLFIHDDLFVTGWQWMKSAYGFTDEQRKPYNYNLGPFLADNNSGNQGYATSEPFAVEKEGGFAPDVFLLADAGYSTISTSIEGMKEYVEANPDITKRFVEASIIGWYNYLYGDNAAANAMIKTENPDMTDEQIAFTIATMKEDGLVDSGIAAEKGIGCFTDAMVQDFYDKMVAAGVVKAGLDIASGYSTEYVCQGLGMDLKK